MEDEGIRQHGKAPVGLGAVQPPGIALGGVIYKEYYRRDRRIKSCKKLERDTPREGNAGDIP